MLPSTSVPNSSPNARNRLSLDNSQEENPGGLRVATMSHYGKSVRLGLIVCTRPPDTRDLETESHANEKTPKGV
ncbi:hypothetical protein M408DRAFT_332990 [Serendipita vermifera MAFF 305830]|uniref:Uncharacterized protein n=1 Tax=Serendipita vermifera MAFF 305830 TaxID=933852 RepID=A0A0C2W0M3_SERVB|nr:hypothetical protein M408DRAFT_334152 [Serendipita vermifera MAFF 305830]KIM22307.1 hypothetical protein M408DRAFT_332990 [Serendipita vermifera MAFF 305830]